MSFSSLRSLASGNWQAWKRVWVPDRWTSARTSPQLIRQSNFLHHVTPVWLKGIIAPWQHAAEAPVACPGSAVCSPQVRRKRGRSWTRLRDKNKNRNLHGLQNDVIQGAEDLGKDCLTRKSTCFRFGEVANAPVTPQGKHCEINPGGWTLRIKPRIFFSKL